MAHLLGLILRKITGIGQLLLLKLSLMVAWYTFMQQWRRAVVVSGVRSMNEANVHRARLVLG